MGGAIAIPGNLALPIPGATPNGRFQTLSRRALKPVIGQSSNLNLAVFRYYLMLGMRLMVSSPTRLAPGTDSSLAVIIPGNPMQLEGRLPENEQKIRILIIEDDVDFSSMLDMHLSAAGYQVQVAEDGVCGGRAMLEQAPDLIISDVSMPFLDGFELLSLMRSDASTASIPVILLSGRSDGDTMAKAVELGAADFLLKPVKLEDLIASVRACLAKLKDRGR